MRILLTGGTGFIGSYVALELAKGGYEVTILARNPDKVPALKTIKQLTVIRGDLTDLRLLDTLVAGKDACIHVALNYTKQTSWEVLQDDTLPTVYLADAAARAGVGHFIYTSSTSANDSLYMAAAEVAYLNISTVTVQTKQHPATFYGAAKAAAENYVLAQSYRSPLRVNIIRPGYTFGNPVVEGASTQSDARFHNMVKTALANEPITVTKNDGTQFIWAGDLARLYIAVLGSTLNRRTYFGLSKKFVTWFAIAEALVKRSGSQSRIILEDKGWKEAGAFWDVSDMQNDFGLSFDPWEKILEHLDYYLGLESGK